MTTSRQKIVISSFDSVDSTHYNGGGAAVVELLAEWLSRECRVVVVTAGRRSDVAVRKQVRYVYLPVSWAGPRAGQVLFHALLPVVARRLSYSLWIESFTPPFSTSFLPLFARAPVLGFAQNLSGTQMWSKYKLPFFIIERLGLRFYRHVVVLNPSDGATVERYSPRAKVRVIPNGVSIPCVSDGEFGDGEHILFIGRVDIWHKGLDLLVEAYSRSSVAMPLLIAGDGTRADERRLSAMLERVPGIRWVGRIAGDQKDELLRRSAYVVMPSRHEPFGMAALEGMAFGKPVVHFDLPTLHWMSGDARVTPFDVDGFADQLRVLSADHAVRARMGRQAYEAVRQFGFDRMEESHVAVVREILMCDGPSLANA